MIDFLRAVVGVLILIGFYLLISTFKWWILGGIVIFAAVLSTVNAIVFALTGKQIKLYKFLAKEK